MKEAIIEELRKIRDAHAAKFNYDFDAIAADWMKEQKAAMRKGQKFVDLSVKSGRKNALKKARGQ